RLVDVGFTLARQSTGSFRFSDGDVEEADVTVAFEPAVAEITAMVGAWKDIETTIPSLEARLRLAAQLPRDEVGTRAAERARLARAGGRRGGGGRAGGGAEPLREGCRRVKDLVDRGAIEVTAASVDATPPAAPAPPAKAAAAATPATPVATAEAEPEAEPEA